MSLTMRAVIAARHFDVTLRVRTGERLALVGPNGAGKSTLLAVLAGILRPDSGSAELDGRVLFDLTNSSSRWLPPWSRGVALLAQDPLLFPHLSAVDNVAFGPRSAGQRRAAARDSARRWLAEVEAEEFADRKPAQLSGGQAQRVAIARALAAAPHLLLLDEPMAALDVTAAPTLRRVLRRVLGHRSAIIVTHDLLDAVLLADRILVIDGGTIVESGATQDVLAHPRTPFTARIAGLNMIVGVGEADGVRNSAGELFRGIVQSEVPAGQPAIAVFSPTAVSIYTEHPHGSPRNTLSVTVVELEPRDEQVRVRAASPDGTTFTAEVTAQTIGELDLYPGRDVYYTIKATAVTIYPA